MHLNNKQMEHLDFSVKKQKIFSNMSENTMKQICFTFSL